MVLNLTPFMARDLPIELGVAVDFAHEERDQLFDALAVPEEGDKELSVRASFIAELACMNNLGPDDGDDPWPSLAVVLDSHPLTEALKLEFHNRCIPVVCVSVTVTGRSTKH